MAQFTGSAGTQASVGSFVALIGPSGAGKTELLQYLTAQAIGVRQVTCTTRPPRDGEKEGVDYYFLSHADFEAKKKADFFLEWELVHGKYFYGTPKQPVIEALEAGHNVLIAIDIKGFRKLRQHSHPLIKKTLAGFFIRAGLETIRNRIIRRPGPNGPIGEDELRRRLATAETELLCQDECNVVIDNNRDGTFYFDAACVCLASAIRFQRRKMSHPPESRRWFKLDWQPRGSALPPATTVAVSATATASA